MEWTFLITAHRRARVDSRILQSLENHRIPLESYASARVGDELRISFVAETDAAGAVRTADLLRRVHDIQSVDWFPREHGVSQTLALFKVLCDQESRLPLLQVLSSVGAQVMAVRPEFVTFQIIAAETDIHGLRESLLPYGVVESISAATAMVRKERAAVAERSGNIEVLPVALSS
jgi:acetolactate synthase small subunit